MFVARDKNGDLYLFDELPRRGNECWWAENGVDGTYLRLGKSLHAEVTWEVDPLPVRLVPLKPQSD